MSSNTTTFQNEDVNLPALFQQLEALLEESPAEDRRRSLLNAFLNLALIPDADFLAANTTRTTTLVALYEDILLWEELTKST